MGSSKEKKKLISVKVNRDNEKCKLMIGLANQMVIGNDKKKKVCFSPGVDIDSRALLSWEFFSVRVPNG